MIYLGDKKAVLCKGDFHPAQLYKGDKKITGYTVEEFSAEGNVTLENCYNDKLYNAQIIGNTVQDDTPTPDTPIEIQSVGELVTEGEYAGKYKIPVRARGKNFVDKNDIKIISANCRSYEKNDDLIIAQGNEGLAANAASAGNIKFIIPETLPSETYTFSMYATLLEEGIWGTSAAIYAGESLDTYSEKMFRYNNIVGVKTRIKFTGTFSNGLGCVVMRLNSSKWLIDISSWQIEEGITVTPYEPYIEPQTFNIYLDEPLRKVGDYADCVDFGKQKVIRLNTEAEILTVGNDYNGRLSLCGRGYYNGENQLLRNGKNRWAPILCSYIDNLGWSNDTRQFISFYYSSFGVANVTELQTKFNEIAESGNPLKVVYTHETPIEEPIDLPELPTFKGTTIYEIDTQIPATISGKYKKLD